MNNYLFHKITYKLHKLGFYYYSAKYYYQDNHKKENIIICLIKSIIKPLKLFNCKYGYYEYLEIPITNKCSLRCKNCSNLIPCYKKRYDYDNSILLKSIKEFFNCIEQIVYIRILGGEPFLSSNLYSVVNTVLKSDKVQRIEIVTNGTIIPKDRKLIRKLRNDRIIICISKYPMVKYEKLVTFLQNNNIKYRVDNMTYWMEYGNISPRNKNIKELKKQYKNCNSICKSLINGQIHLCPRSSHGTDLGIITDNEDDYIDILDSSISIKEKKNKLNKLFKKKYIKACNYCDYGTKKSKKIPVAEQIKTS